MTTDEFLHKEAARLAEHFAQSPNSALNPVFLYDMMRVIADFAEMKEREKIARSN